MGKEKQISQNELEEELEDLVFNLETKDELAFARYYINAQEKKGYSVKRFKDFVELIEHFSKIKLNIESYKLN